MEVLKNCVKHSKIIKVLGRIFTNEDELFQLIISCFLYGAAGFVKFMMWQNMPDDCLRKFCRKSLNFWFSEAITRLLLILYEFEFVEFCVSFGRERDDIDK